MAAKAKAAYADHQFTDPAPASFAFMLSKNGYLLGADGPWRPHVMPFIAYDQLATWGASFKGSPIFAPPPSAGFRPYQPVTIHSGVPLVRRFARSKVTCAKFKTGAEVPNLAHIHQMNLASTRSM